MQELEGWLPKGTKIYKLERFNKWKVVKNWASMNNSLVEACAMLVIWLAEKEKLDLNEKKK